MITNIDTIIYQNKRGDQVTWSICVDDCTVITTFGRLNGKMQESRKTFTSSINVGKCNEKTPPQRALDYAKRTAKKKRESVDTGGIFPMLAHSYNDYFHKVEFPCYLQPKYDGYRCLWSPRDGYFYSRQDKVFKGIPQFFSHIFDMAIVERLDGEIMPLKSDNFNDLGSIRENNVQQDFTERFKYVVYDFIPRNVNITYEDRLTYLQTWQAENLLPPFMEVAQTYYAVTRDNIKQQHGNFVSCGFEGTIIRNINGPYIKRYRSTDVLKYKDFNDAEYPIYNVLYESNNEKKLIIYEILLPNGKTCSVRPKGNLNDREQLYTDFLTGQFNPIGKSLWVKYFEMTPDGSLRFPTTMRDTPKEYIRSAVL